MVARYSGAILGGFTVYIYIFIYNIYIYIRLKTKKKDLV